jgi:RNA-directed DNA polymerase
MKKLRQIYLTWQLLLLQTYANLWFTALRRYKGAVGHHSSWWGFVYLYQVTRDLWLMKFIHGRYRFSPMQCLHFPEETITIWDYPDRLILFLLLKIITPTFKHIISKQCLHLGGPNQVKPALAQIKNAVKNGCFSYALRIDIRSYYASIQHNILIEQIHQHFADPRVLRYLEDIITIAIDDGGDILLPTQGIPRRRETLKLKPKL